jgi:hypothetical protein
MGKKILAVSLVVVMALSFSACGEEELPTAQEIVDGTIQAMDDVRAYEFEIDMSLGMTAEAEGETLEVTIDIDSSGALDLDNRQMKMDFTMSAIVPGEDETEMAIEAYLIDGAGYTMTDEPETGPVWEKEEFSEAEWEETWEEAREMLNLTEPQIELLETAEVEVIGSEKVDGIDCYVVEVTTDIKQLWGSVWQQAALGFAEEADLEELLELPDEIFDAASYSASAKQWVAKDTYFLMKAEIEMTMYVTPESMGFPDEEGEATIDIAMTLLVHDYNQPVSIELPPEAEEATEY